MHSRHMDRMHRSAGSLASAQVEHPKTLGFGAEADTYIKQRFPAIVPALGRRREMRLANLRRKWAILAESSKAALRREFPELRGMA